MRHVPRRRTSSTYLVVTPTDIVITHGSERETVISFHPTNSDGTLSNVCTDVLLQRDVVVEQKPSIIRDQYVACICQEWHTNTVMTIVYHVPNQIEVCQVDMTQYHVFQGEK